MTIRLVRIFTGADGQSHFTVGEVAWETIAGASARSTKQEAEYVSFEETAAGSSLDWHNAPQRQYVVTLTGRLAFETRGGETETIGPGDVLLAEDVTGGGHRWRLVDDQPWRRVYVGLPSDKTETTAVQP